MTQPHIEIELPELDREKKDILLDWLAKLIADDIIREMEYEHAN